ncbi:class I adenylate cyclase [Stutzerimonas urumqiensis]|uniref:class I adenylate cyclase n=1 Tax=Stutzerimonas urumqiensis TaxID=638269 RepID=UPI000EAEA3F1|nr:class I adenylate cyclase [Stutzerimonas urumqiensis]
MNCQELRPVLEEGIDRQTLTRIRARFLTVNAGRLERSMQAMSTRQQQVLRLLPLLFHVNHPILPGYVSARAPAGLDGFEPNAELLAEAQRLSRSFIYQPRRTLEPRAIQGLYLMGSLGTVAQDEQSDLDVWVCHDPALPAEARDALRRKCDLLQQWAAGQGASATFFLIDPAAFACGAREACLTSDDCGTTQHYLLLDEFYRTALWLGGRTPLWWLVPAYEEHRYGAYVETLVSRRFIRAEDHIDLGHLGAIPPGEFLGAGLWQMFKGIESPYKSAIKLLLTEAYASEHPQVDCLSLRLKHAIYANRLDLDELDPYISVYRRLEEYLLARGDRERLELVRRSLYLKINRKLSRPAPTPIRSWQRQVIGRLTREWGWDERQLASLDGRARWKVRQVIAERSALVNALTCSYRFLSQFARSHQAESPLSGRDLSILGRRLYAAFERKAGKVEFINPGISPDMAEETLTLVRTEEAPGEAHWALYQGSLNAREWSDYAPLKRVRELLPLLAWCHRNGVVDGGTHLSLYAGDSGLTEPDLHSLLASLRQLMPMPLAPVTEQDLLAPSMPRRVVLLINLDAPAPAAAVAPEDQVASIDQLVLNSWNELLVNRYEGDHGLLDCLRDHLVALPDDPSTAIELHVRCLGNNGLAIARRIDQLFVEVTSALRQAPGSRYLLQLRGRHLLLDLTPGEIAYVPLPDQAALFERLSQPTDAYRPIQLDRQALPGQHLATVLGHGRPDCLQVFYRVVGEQAELMVLDEHNALWHQRQPFRDEQSLLRPLQRFLQSVLYRHNALLPLPGRSPTGMRDLLFYRVLPGDGREPARLERRPPPLSAASDPYYDVQAILEPGEAGRAHVTLFCNHREFSELEHGPRLFTEAARHILSQRAGGERYPCYITDLDLSGLAGQAAQTVQYLRYKARLEAGLNQALDRLSHTALP